MMDELYWVTRMDTRRITSIVRSQKSEFGVRHVGSQVATCPAAGRRGRLSSVFASPASGVRRPSSGFSLVEVTLALMVMAIGILSIMSLFPAGLDQNARSIADTHAAFFAEEVFGGLHATAETNWAGLANVSLPVAARYDMWPDVTNQIQVTGTNITTIVYKYTPSAITYEDHALRYRLALTNNGLLKAATLWVWPGEFGSTNDPSIFYAEFFRWKP